MAGTSYKRELADHARILARDARNEFGEFLSRPEWEWYVTQTFAGDFMSPKLGDKHYYAWLKSLELACKARDMPRPFYFRVTELQQREVIHYHSLIGGVADIRRLLFKDFWELHGFARVEAYEPNRGANFYVGKYLTKTDSDIRFSHNLTQHLTQLETRTIIGGNNGKA
ncbi:unnamed protein product [marine sediment metagenome]|uniref:Replication-associated protein ORF2/G2P domain-containing protein n=1 Tax=marine sediment metagenome TaxID=412755 RepID=X1QJU2_9ZZZZ